MPTRPERDEMLMMDPNPFERIARIAYLQPRKTPSRLVRCTARQSSRLAFSGSCALAAASSPVMPALSDLAKVQRSPESML